MQTLLVTKFTSLNDPQLAAIHRAAKPGYNSAGYAVEVYGNCYAACADDAYVTWGAASEAGRGYMVGKECPMEKFVATHSSPLTPWQKLAYTWCMANPTKALNLANSRFEWTVALRGEYVVFALPHHDRGGEKGYISRNGQSKLHINED